MSETQAPPQRQEHPSVLSVVVVDAQDLFARSLELALPEASGGRIEVVATAGTVDEAYSRITELAPDLALVNLRLAESGALALLARVQADGSRTHFVGVGDQDDCDEATAALAGGFDAVVTKESGPEHLLASILAVLQGWRVLAPSLLEGLLARASRPGSEILAELDDQTIELWLLVADGLELSGIGEKLNVSERTAKRLVANLRDRLGAQSRLQMAAMAGRVGLLDGDHGPLRSGQAISAP